MEIGNDRAKVFWSQQFVLSQLDDCFGNDPDRLPIDGAQPGQQAIHVVSFTRSLPHL